MPYLILAIGVLTGSYALYRFFLSADVKQIKSAFLAMIFVSLSLALLYMAVTGRLPAALALLAALLPFASGFWKARRAQRAAQGHMEKGHMINTRKEALDILGLDENAGETDIKKAYKRLMQKIHPDHEGSEWMAAKLNQAYDLLLPQKRRSG